MDNWISETISVRKCLAFRKEIACYLKARMLFLVYCERCGMPLIIS